MKEAALMAAFSFLLRGRDESHCRSQIGGVRQSAKTKNITAKLGFINQSSNISPTLF
jgi:hypothetical protein